MDDKKYFFISAIFLISKYSAQTAGWALKYIRASRRFCLSFLPPYID